MHIGFLKAGKYSCQINFKIHVQVLVIFNSVYEFKVIWHIFWNIEWFIYIFSYVPNALFGKKKIAGL